MATPTNYAGVCIQANDNSIVFYYVGVVPCLYYNMIKQHFLIQQTENIIK